MQVIQLLLAVLLTPLLSAVMIALFFRRLGGTASIISVSAAVTIFLMSLLAMLAADGKDIISSWEWLSLGQFEVSIGFLFDGLSATMLSMVVFVSLLIHIFSLGYMAGDQSRARFFGGLSIFMFSMVGIVLANNLIMMFIFWELVGFSSYMLIGHYMDTDEAAAASKKAFIVNRVGDLGFLIGIVCAYWHFGTTSFNVMRSLTDSNSELVSVTIAALLMCGFLGKSAQFPLHVWLPDAMAGPTPVSALIHAATMVAAGVYFLIRIEFLFPLEVLNFIAWLGTSVAVYAGFCAYGQDDIKKILAYSTLSQLGYMSAAFGLGYPGVALFHLITHAFFKALLFLGAGSVIHGCQHEQNIFKMGGLLKKMPCTAFTFLVGILALCGVYGLSGFYSKDAILIAAGLENTAIFGLLTFGAFLTAGYMGRLFWITFLGHPKSDLAVHAKESPLSMLVPLIILSLLSIASGWITLWPEFLGLIIKGNLHDIHYLDGYASVHQKVLIFGTVAWFFGFVLSFFFYGIGSKGDNLEQKAPKIYGLLRGRLWFDEIYGYYVAKIQQRLAQFLSFLDVFLIRGILVRGSAGLVGVLSAYSRSLHDGNLHTYVYWFIFGLIGLWAIASVQL